MAVLTLIFVLLVGVIAGALLFLYLSKDKEPKTPEEKLMALPELLEETGYTIRATPTQAGQNNIIGFITDRRHNVYHPETGENRTKLKVKKLDGGETWEWEDVYNKANHEFVPNVIADGHVFMPMMKNLNQDDNLNDLAWRLSKPKMVNHLKSKAKDTDVIYQSLQRTKNQYKSLHNQYKTIKSENEQLSTEVRSLNIENDKLNRTVSNLASENNRLKEELRRQDTRVKELEKTIKDYQDIEGVTEIEPIRPAHDQARKERTERERSIREEQAKAAQAEEPTERPEEEAAEGG